MIGQGAALVEQGESRAGEGADTALARFLLVLRSKGLTDAALLNAFEAVPRAIFLPHVRPALLFEPVFLPLPCGEEAMDAASLARLIMLLDIRPGMAIAEIGAGSGFVSALLDRLGMRVLAFERYRTLIAGAERAFARIGVGRVTLMQRDGLARGAIQEPVERILLHGAVEHAPQHLFEALVAGGQALGFRQKGDGCRLTLWKKDEQGFISESDLGPIRAPRLRSGLPRAL